VSYQYVGLILRLSALPMPRKISVKRYRVPTPAESRSVFAVAGVAASVLLHGLLLTPLLWGGHHHARPMPNDEGASASPHDAKSLESMMVVFMEDSAAIHDPSESEDALTHFLLPEPPILPIARPRVSVEALALNQELDDDAPSEANGDQAGRALLYGRYMGQVSARITRAWLRPRTAPAGGAFACRVQITQDKQRIVQEVTLQQCTSDPKWQVSLVRAINAASPLPAPPDSSVFSNLLTLEFDSDPFVVGTRDDGFEPATSNPIASSNSKSSTASPAPRMRPDGSVDLTIVGSRGL
jgi:TonB C terminal